MMFRMHIRNPSFLSFLKTVFIFVEPQISQIAIQQMTKKYPKISVSFF